MLRTLKNNLHSDLFATHSEQFPATMETTGGISITVGEQEICQPNPTVVDIFRKISMNNQATKNYLTFWRIKTQLQESM